MPAETNNSDARRYEIHHAVIHRAVTHRAVTHRAVTHRAVTHRPGALDRLTFSLAGASSLTVAVAASSSMVGPVAEAAASIAMAWAAREWFNRRGPSVPAAWTAPVLAALGALPVACEPLRSWLLGQELPLEWQLLAGLRNVVLGLAAMSRWPACLRLAGLASLFVVLCAVSLGEGRAVVSACALYLLIGGTWLVRLNWNGRRGAALTVIHEPIPNRAVAVVLVCVIGAGLAGAALAPPSALAALRGFIPSSGGTRWYDPAAHSGVNDGDDVVAADKNAQSVGMTDSSLFLDCDDPSLYDALSEAYGEPIRRKQNERAIALGVRETKEVENRAAENQKAGREFATVRGRRPRPRPMGDLKSEALVYVEGRVPLHLRLAAYDRFDGVTWEATLTTDTAENAESANVPSKSLAATGDGTWMGVVTPLDLPIFLCDELHRIKIARLASDAVPSPPHLARFRLEQVNRVNFFRWSALDTLHVDRSRLPSGTVVDTDCQIVDTERMRALRCLVPSHDPDATISNEVRRLAESWTAGLRPGWRQIETVVERLRQHCVVDRDAQLPADCTDAVGHFLFQSQRGPDYQFASAAAVLLRALGYSTRLVSGFYANPQRFDLQARNTPVIKDDVHVWVEVRLAGDDWTPIEPTPTYELLGPPLGWGARAVALCVQLGRWALAHWVALGGPVKTWAFGLLAWSAASTVFVPTS